MPREKPTYRDNLELIYERFGNEKVMLNQKETAIFLGMDARTVKNIVPMNGHYISVANLARWMCG